MLFGVSLIACSFKVAQLNTDSGMRRLLAPRCALAFDESLISAEDWQLINDMYENPRNQATTRAERE